MLRIWPGLSKPDLKDGYQFPDFQSLNIIVLFNLGWIAVMHQAAPPLQVSITHKLILVQRGFIQRFLGFEQSSPRIGGSASADYGAYKRSHEEAAYKNRVC